MGKGEYRYGIIILCNTDTRIFAEHMLTEVWGIWLNFHISMSLWGRVA